MLSEDPAVLLAEYWRPAACFLPTNPNCRQALPLALQWAEWEGLGEVGVVVQ